MTNRPSIESRRRDPRVREPDVVATIVTPAGATMCSAHDLSVGGARLVASGALRLALGDRVDVILGDRRDPGSLRLSGVVLRLETIDDHWSSVALKFDSLPDPVHEAIQGVVLRSLKRQQLTGRKTVLVVGGEAAVRRALELDLGALGYTVISVAAPLNAIRCLLDDGARIDAAIIDVDPGPASGVDVLGYLAEERPDIRRVVMSARPAQELTSALSGARWNAVLDVPWRHDALAAALGPRS